MNAFTDIICEEIKTKIEDGVTMQFLADESGIPIRHIRNMLKEKYNATVIELRTPTLTTEECFAIKNRLEKGASTRSILNEFVLTLAHLNINLRRECNTTTTKLGAAFRKSLDASAAKARKEILQNGVKSVPAYLKEHPTLLTNTSFRQHLNLPPDQIFSAKRKYSKESLRNKYKELLVEYNGELPITKLQKVDPTLTSLIYYHFGNIRKFRATL